MEQNIKPGDSVEVLPGRGNAGVEAGEQGLVIGISHSKCLMIIFPANPILTWAEDDGDGWWTLPKNVKLIYHP